MSDNSFAAFVTRNRTAIIATAAVGASAAGAYYYYKQSLTAPEKKKSKKKAKKSKKEAPPPAAKIYPVDAEGNPLIEDSWVQSLSAEEKEKYAVALKEDGNEFFKNKDFNKAVDFYTAALKLKEDPVFYSNRSACYVGLEDSEKVIADTTRALEINPGYSKCLLRRATAHEQLGNFADAMFDLTALTFYGGFSQQSIEPILERNMNKQAAKVLESKLKERKFLLPSASSISSFFGVFKEELEVEGVAPEAAEGSGDYFLLQGLKNLYSKTDEAYVAADALFSQALEAYKTEGVTKCAKVAVANEYVGIMKFLKNDPIDATLHFQEALDNFPRARTYVFLALIFADKSDFDGAEQYFKLAEEMEPENAAIFYHRGQLQYITGKLDEAAVNFDKAKELDPENVFSYIQIACIAYRQGKLDDADTLFSEAKRRFPTAPEIANYYGEILADKGDIQGALKQFDISYKLQEALRPVVSVGVLPMINKATLLTKEPYPENIEKAADLLQEACDKDPRSEVARLTLAQCRLQQDKVVDAIKLFEEASDLSRNLEEKLQATTFAEASKVQLRVKNDPVLSVKVNEMIAAYQAQGLA